METRSDILGDLLRINKDCSEAYERIIAKHSNDNLYPLLEKLVDLERDCLRELRSQVDAAFGDPADAVERRGEIYRAWQEKTEKNVPSGEKEIYTYCERRLHAIHFAYDRALNRCAGFPEQVVHMLSQHVERMKESVTSIRNFKKNRPVRSGRLAAMPR